jgi:hypothetical protein
MDEAEILFGIIVVGEVRDTIRKVKISVIPIIAATLRLFIIILISSAISINTISPWSRRVTSGWIDWVSPFSTIISTIIVTADTRNSSIILNGIVIIIKE